MCGSVARGAKHSGAALYLPAEARFDPDAADAEVTELLGSNENVYLWHPACGLIGFEPGDRRRVADLLQAPPEQRSRLGLGRAGSPLQPAADGDRARLDAVGRVRA